jgi:hypothetical protein
MSLLLNCYHEIGDFTTETPEAAYLVIHYLYIVESITTDGKGWGKMLKMSKRLESSRIKERFY